MRFMEAIAKRILDLMKERHIKKTKFCKDIKISISHFNTIISGKNKDIRSNVLYRIIKGLGLKQSEFFDSDMFEDKNLID